MVSDMSNIYLNNELETKLNEVAHVNGVASEELSNILLALSLKERTQIEHAVGLIKTFNDDSTIPSY